MSMSHQQHYHQHSPQQGSPAKQDNPSSAASTNNSTPYLSKDLPIKQETPSYHTQQAPIFPPGQSSYASSPYLSANSHLLGLNLGHGHGGLMSTPASGTATPVLNGSAPPSPTMNGGNNYNYNSSISGSSGANGGNGTGAGASNANSPYVSHQSSPYHSQYQTSSGPYQAHHNGSSGNLPSGYYAGSGNGANASN
ncbi:hypothetical protein BG004_004482, partial [Podila humilis]